MTRAIMCGTDISRYGADITAQCHHKGNYWFVPNSDNSFSYNERQEGSTAHTLWISAYGTHKYKVECALMLPGLPYFNFLFTDFNFINLVVTSNDESVSQYVTQVDDRTFIIETPENCGELGITYYVEAGIKVYLLEDW